MSSNVVALYNVINKVTLEFNVAPTVRNFSSFSWRGRPQAYTCVGPPIFHKLTEQHPHLFGPEWDSYSGSEVLLMNSQGPTHPTTEVIINHASNSIKTQEKTNPIKIQLIHERIVWQKYTSTTFHYAFSVSVCGTSQNKMSGKPSLSTIMLENSEWPLVTQHANLFTVK